MKKVIEFSKYRFMAFIFSFVVLIAGIIGVAIRGEFNLGIDFVGGLSQRIQFAPVAFSLTYEGDGSASGVIQGKTLSFSIIEAGEKNDYFFNFNDYNTVDELAADIGKVTNISVDLESNKAKSDPTMLLATEYDEVIDNEGGFKINIELGDEQEIVATKEKVVAALSEFNRIRVQAVGNELSQEFILKIHMKDILESTGTESEELGESVQLEMESKIKIALARVFEEETVLLRKQDFTGPSFSKEIFQGSVFSIILVVILILAYISFRFKFSYAIAAVVALIHDISIMVVVIGAFQLEVTGTTVAAILTIFGYSLNDTIVVFDRVRENFTLLRELDRESVINTSVTQSLSRTIITSLTTLLAVLSIYFLSPGGVIKDFAFNLIIGIVVGTYSSIFIASPIVLTWLNLGDKRKKARQEQKIGKKKTPAKKSIKTPIAKKEVINEPSGSPEAAKVQTTKKRKKKKKK